MVHMFEFYGSLKLNSEVQVKIDLRIEFKNFQVKIFWQDKPDYVSAVLYTV